MFRVNQYMLGIKIQEVACTYQFYKVKLSVLATCMFRKTIVNTKFHQALCELPSFCKGVNTSLSFESGITLQPVLQHIIKTCFCKRNTSLSHDSGVKC